MGTAAQRSPPRDCQAEMEAREAHGQYRAMQDVLDGLARPPPGAGIEIQRARSGSRVVVCRPLRPARHCGNSWP
eukprot:5808502-Lingulodinium_polyedra.AAC.1